MIASPVESLETRDDDPHRATGRGFRQALVGLFASGAMHGFGAFACGLALLGIFDWLAIFLQPPPPPTPVVIVAAVERSDEPIDLTATVYDDRTAEEHLAEYAARGDDWSFDLVANGIEPRNAEAPLHKDSVAVQSVAAEWVEQASEQGQKRSTEENLEQLDELGERITAVSSEQAVGEIGDVLSKALNLEDRATAPAEPSSEAEPRLFESASAQLHDVRLERDEASGSERYVATLVDRHGTAIEMEMDPASGKQAYDVMQTIKKYPLLESVYRAVVMKILDRLIEPTPVEPTS